MSVTKGSTWISLCDPDVEDTMTREEALDLAIRALDNTQVQQERNGDYSLAATTHGARTILERMRDEQ